MIEVELDHAQWQRVAQACQDESDGRGLRRDITTKVCTALEPAVGEVVSALMSTPQTGGSHAGVPLLPAIAREVDTEVILGGHSAGAFVVAGNAAMPRGFRHAPKRFNRRRGWHHPTFGHGPQVHQVGQPDWFDGPLQRRRGQYQDAVLDAVDDMAGRIARKG